MSDTAKRGASKSEWHLLDEREFLVRSLEDAAAEHAAGDLDGADYALLRARDEQRLAQVEAQIDAAAAQTATELAAAQTATADASPGTTETAASSPKRPRGVAGAPRRRFRFVRWRRRWWLGAGGAALLMAAVVVLAVQLATPRLPGQIATGSIDLNPAQRVEKQLAQAETLVNHGKDSRALELYGTVISEDPRDPTALAEWGWLDWQAAERAKQATVAAEGASALEEAATLDPRLFAAQYYLGVVLMQEGDPAKAVTHFSQFLADHPTSKWVDEAAPQLRAAYAAAHLSVPPGVPKG
jgi:tetratricopeptide (TPR) repeat protein